MSLHFIEEESEEVYRHSGRASSRLLTPSLHLSSYPHSVHASVPRSFTYHTLCPFLLLPHPSLHPSLPPSLPLFIIPPSLNLPSLPPSSIHLRTHSIRLSFHPSVLMSAFFHPSILPFIPLRPSLHPSLCLSICPFLRPATIYGSPGCQVLSLVIPRCSGFSWLSGMVTVVWTSCGRRHILGPQARGGQLLQPPRAGGGEAGSCGSEMNGVNLAMGVFFPQTVRSSAQQSQRLLGGRRSAAAQAAPLHRDLQAPKVPGVC